MIGRKRSRQATIAQVRRVLIEVAGPLIPSTMAATIAWLIAKQVGDHPDPFFAPLAAVIALNAPLGERGLNTLRLLTGVVVGIAVGGITVGLLGGGYVALALAVFVAMAIARLLGGFRIVIAQAAAGAILAVASIGTMSGIDRLIDALIGGGVALAFSQVFFTPQPVALLRRAQAGLLQEMALALQMNAEAIERDDGQLARQAVIALRELRNQMGELARLRTASRRVARHSLLWRSQLPQVIRESEEATHLELLGGSCLMLARVSMVTSIRDGPVIASSIADLAAALVGLGNGLGARVARQRAAETALRVAQGLPTPDGEMDPALIAIITATRLVAIDVMTYAGVEPNQVHAALEAGDGAVTVSTPPGIGAHPFGARRWRGRRWPHQRAGSGENDGSIRSRM